MSDGSPSKTRLLILGGSGMLGHKLWQIARAQVETHATLRSPAAVAPLGFPGDEMQYPVDAFHFDGVVRAIANVKPTVVVNCIGIVKQLRAAKDPVESITINALFPHRLAEVCRAAGARLIHISTDCVFSGRTGKYKETDFADGEDLYGRSKFLGEVAGDSALTLRTSIIGREISTRSGLVEWFLGNAGGRVHGFSHAVFSGLTTHELSRLIVRVAEEFPDLAGVYNVSADPINKYDLLCLLRQAYGIDVEIESDPAFTIDRSLDSSRLRAATGYQPPSWPEMIKELSTDTTTYLDWRSTDDA